MALDAALRPSFSLDDALGISSDVAEAAPEKPAPEPKVPEVDDAASKVEASRAEFKAKAEPLLGEVRENRDAAAALALPELKPLPAAPDRVDRDPIEAFGSIASTLAIFGSMLTREPLTNALNSAAGVVEAWKNQDATAAAREFDTWKINVDNAKTLHNWQQEHYKNAIAKLDTDTDGALKEIGILATMYRDDVTAELARTKQINELLKLDASRRASMDDMARAEILIERRQNYQNWLAGNPNASNEEKADALARFTSAGAFKPELTYETALTAVDAFIAGDKEMARALVGSDTASRTKFAKFVNQRLEDLKIPPESRGRLIASADALFQGEKTSTRELAKLQVKFAAFKGNAEALADQVVTRSAGFERFGNLPMNRVLKLASRELGDVAVSRFQVALNSFKFDYGRALQMVGVTTDSSRKHIDEMFSEELTHAQIVGNIDQAKLEMKLIGENFGNVKDLITTLWKSTTPTVAPEVGDPPTDEDEPTTKKKADAGVEPRPKTVKPADTNTLPTDNDEPVAPASRAEPNGQGAPPKVLPLPPRTPNSAAMLQDGGLYPPGYWDAATQKFYKTPRKKAAP